MKKLLAVCLFSLLSISSVLACGPEALDILGDGNVLLNADGLTKLVTNSRGNVLRETRVEAKLNFNETARSNRIGGSEFSIRLEDQKRDAGGIIYSSYEVTETNSSVRPAKLEVNRYKIYSKYTGNGVSAACGLIENESDSEIIK